MSDPARQRARGTHQLFTMATRAIAARAAVTLKTDDPMKTEPPKVGKTTREFVLYYWDPCGAWREFETLKNLAHARSLAAAENMESGEWFIVERTSKVVAS